MPSLYSKESPVTAGVETVVGNDEYPLDGVPSTITIQIENLTGSQQDTLDLLRVQLKSSKSTGFLNFLSSTPSDDFASFAASTNDRCKRVSTYDSSGDKIVQSAGTLEPGEKAVIEMNVGSYQSFRVIAKSTSATTVRLDVSYFSI